MDAALRRHGGRLRLHAGGEEISPLFFSLPRPETDPGLLRFRRAGFRVLLFPATADFHLYGLAEPCWLGPDEYDYGPLLRRIERTLERVPDLWLLPRVYTGSPPWWDDAHPEELVVWEDAPVDAPLEHGAGKARVPSLASAVWRAASARNLARFVAAIEASPFAERVVGYHLCGLTSEEWFHHGTAEGYRGDCGPAAAAAFARWRRAKGREHDAIIPPRAERDRAPGAWRTRDPVADAPARDYERFLSDLVADTLLEGARALREASHDDRIIGAFYGYLAGLSHHDPGLREGGHLAIDRVLDAPELDYVASPASYFRRRAGGGATTEMMPGGSARRRGKAWFLELDGRPHRAPRTASLEPARDASEAIAVLERDLGFAFARADGAWVYDMGGDWYEDERLEAALARGQGLAARVTATPRSPAPPVALILDPDSFTAQPAFLLQWRMMTAEQIFELARSGLDYEVLTTRDLLAGTDHRLVIMGNHLSVPRETRAPLRAALEHCFRSVVWIGAPGIDDGRSLSVANARDLCGFSLAPRIRPGVNRTRTVADGQISAGWIWGSPHWVEASPAVQDEDIIVRGHFSDGGEVSFATRRDVAGIRSFAATPALPAPLLRRLAREAGISVDETRDDQVVRDPAFEMRHVRDDPHPRGEIGTTIIIPRED